MTDRPRIDQVYAGPIDLPPLGALDNLPARQAEWRADFADQLYGPFPCPPDDLTVQAQPLAHADRLILTITVQGRSFTTDAALWRPATSDPAPLIAGLDFAGPIGILSDADYPLDANAIAYTRPELGAPDGRLHDVLRGATAYRWPVDLLTSHGYAVLVSCYGSWVPDDPKLWMSHGLYPLLHQDTRVISLWAWALLRLIDTAEQIDGIDTSRIAVAGHSRLGKAALWAAAQDSRIGAVLANNAGCGGTAPARHSIGETLDEMATTFPHWIRPQHGLPQIDQHQLIASVAPRKVYVSSAQRDTSADPLGSFMALKAAAPAWGRAIDWPEPTDIWQGEDTPAHTALGHHIRRGGHDLLPYDWRKFLQFLDRSQLTR